MKITKSIRLLFMAILCLFNVNLSFAQEHPNKNVFRGIVGVSTIYDDDDKMNFGPAVQIEYQYNLSKYFGLTTNVGVARNRANSEPIYSNYDVAFASVGTMITPFPNKFRWIKLGVAFNYIHERLQFEVISDNLGKQFYNDLSNEFGMSYSLRGHIIDNSKFELFASYVLQTRFRNKFDWRTSIVGMGFGIKF